MTFFEEYKDFEERVSEAYHNKIQEIGSIHFLENEDEDLDGVEDCPTSYYNEGNSGEEKHIYITKIDTDGIHIVESDDYDNRYCIDLSDLNGLFYRIDLLETIEQKLK